MLSRCAVGSALIAALSIGAGCGDGEEPGAGPDAENRDAGAGADAGTAIVDAGAPDGSPDTADQLAVCATGGDFSTIAAAIAAAAPGDTIVVCAGTYFEHLVVDRALRIVGTDGAPSTVIDGGGNGRIVDVTGVASPGVYLEGLTFRNGSAADSGGGVRCSAGVLEIRDSAVLDSHALEGAGLYAQQCAVVVSSSRLEGNVAGERGGGAFLVDSTGSFEQVELVANEARAGGGAAVSGGDLAIEDSLFSENLASLQGGGLFYAGDAVIERSVFADNESGWTGGGIYFDQHAPTLRDSEIRANVSENDGGGIYVHQSEAVISGNAFEDNVSGDDGGGIRIFESYSLVDDNVVRGNYAADSGGGIRISHLPSQFIDNHILDNEAFGLGGGMDLDNDSSTVIGGIIEGNVAGGSGGGIHAWLFPWLGGTIAGVRIAGNSAWQGGGLYLRHNYQSVALRDLEIDGNVAAHGAGLVVRTTPFSLWHSSFSDNVAQAEGGAISVGPDGSPFSGDCPCPPGDATGSIQFVVAHGNVAPDGGSALWARSPSLAVGSSVLSDNAGTAVAIDGPTPAWTYNDVYPSSFEGMIDPAGSGGNISSPPEFAGAGDFHLEPTSPCIDSGDPAFVDLDGTRADMGVYGGLGGQQ